jgi:hypothetical protein
MRYCNWQTTAAMRSGQLISLLSKLNKDAASRLYLRSLRRSRDDHFQPRKTALRKMTTAFSPPAADISSENSSASRVRR